MDGGIQLEKEIQIHQKIRSLAAKTQLWTGSLVNKVTGLPRGTNISHLPAQRAHDMIPPLGIIIGTAAFGFWWHSIAAGLFACCGLFFLAGIYKATERIVGVVLSWERDRMVGPNPNRDASTSAEPSHGNIDRHKSMAYKLTYESVEERFIKGAGCRRETFDQPAYANPVVRSPPGSAL